MIPLKAREPFIAIILPYTVRCLLFAHVNIVYHSILIASICLNIHVGTALFVYVPHPGDRISSSSCVYILFTSYLTHI